MAEFRSAVVCVAAVKVVEDPDADKPPGVASYGSAASTPRNAVIAPAPPSPFAALESTTAKLVALTSAAVATLVNRSPLQVLLPDCPTVAPVTELHPLNVAAASVWPESLLLWMMLANITSPTAKAVGLAIESAVVVVVALCDPMLVICAKAFPAQSALVTNTAKINDVFLMELQHRLPKLNSLVFISLDFD
jgi:hypothetical protein